MFDTTLCKIIFIISFLVLRLFLFDAIILFWIQILSLFLEIFCKRSWSIITTDFAHVAYAVACEIDVRACTYLVNSYFQQWTQASKRYSVYGPYSCVKEERMSNMSSNLFPYQVQYRCAVFIQCNKLSGYSILAMCSSYTVHIERWTEKVFKVLANTCQVFVLVTLW